MGVRPSGRLGTVEQSARELNRVQLDCFHSISWMLEMRIFSPAERPFGEIPNHIAVAITQSGPNQRHVGILYRGEKYGSGDSFSLLHLPWHFRPVNEDRPHPVYAWIDPQCARSRGRQLSAICRKVARENVRGIPYGFSPPNDCFNKKTFAFELGPNRYGLTCSTFVLAIFELAGLRLVAEESWPKNRPEDAQWREMIIESLRRSRKPNVDAHITLLRNDSSTVRFRPEEVAGAAACENNPAAFEHASSQAIHIIEVLTKEGLSLPGSE